MAAWMHRLSMICARRGASFWLRTLGMIRGDVARKVIAARRAAAPRRRGRAFPRLVEIGSADRPRAWA